jgi:hypothetical protein
VQRYCSLQIEWAVEMRPHRYSEYSALSTVY